MNTLHPSLLLIPLISAFSPMITAQEATELPPAEPVAVAVLDFEATDRRAPTLGKDAADLLTVSLMMDPGLILVERSRLAEALSEQELGLSGMVRAETAATVGQLTGANVLISGRIFDVGAERFMVSRVISAETGRVFAEKVSYSRDGELSAASDELGEKIAARVASERDALIAETETAEDVVVQLEEVVGDRPLPTVSIKIPEEHIGRPVPDPAAETEIAMILQKLGFEIVEASSRGADVEITGEAFSELGMTKGNLVSCRGRLEVKAVEGDAVIFVGRETTIAVDLAENFAGKKALQQAGLEMAKLLTPALVADR